MVLDRRSRSSKDHVSIIAERKDAGSRNILRKEVLEPICPCRGMCPGLRWVSSQPVDCNDTKRKVVSGLRYCGIENLACQVIAKYYQDQNKV